MASVPPASAFRSAHARHHEGLMAMHPGSVIIDSITCACAVDVGPVTFEPLATGGTARVQRIRCAIRKTLLAEPPRPDTLIRHGGVDFKIKETGGRNAHEAAWVIEGIRWID